MPRVNSRSPGQARDEGQRTRVHGLCQPPLVWVCGGGEGRFRMRAGRSREAGMAVTVTPTEHRPAAVRITVGVLAFLGISAFAGGVALVLGVGAAPPADWLDDIPLIDSWVVP